MAAILEILIAFAIFALYGSRCAATPRLVDLTVSCDRSGHHVTVRFDKPFEGIIFANGYYHQPDCHFVKPSHTSQTEFRFVVPVGRCGTSSGSPSQANIVESTLIVQNDINFQSVTDSAHSIRCSWADSYLKQVNSKPIRVVDPQLIPVTLVPSDSRSDSSQQSHTIRSVDKAVTIYVQNATVYQDVNVLDCMALDPVGRTAVHLSDKDGCIIRPDLLSPFRQFRPDLPNWRGIVLKSIFKESKMEVTPVGHVNIKCNIILCQGKCPQYCSS